MKREIAQWALNLMKVQHYHSFLKVTGPPGQDPFREAAGTDESVEVMRPWFFGHHPGRGWMLAGPEEMISH